MRSPPPPPPPPGPGVARKTSRIGSAGASGSVGSLVAAKLRLPTRRIVAATSPCRVVETASGTVVGRRARGPSPNSSRPKTPGAAGMATGSPAKSARTARTASSCGTK